MRVLDVPQSPFPALSACLALAGLSACKVAGAGLEPIPGPDPAAAMVDPTPAASAEPRSSNDTFAYLLAKYDADRDGAITRAEYARRDGQLERWDRDGDGRLTEADWPEDALQVSPQIAELQKQRILGRYFQVDDDEGVLTIDEMAEAFFAYDGADGSEPDEQLRQSEFLAVAEERSTVLPGDSSMIMQSYAAGIEPWSTLLSYYDYDRNGALDLTELCKPLEDGDVYEVRFDLEHCDAGSAAPEDFDSKAYFEGLAVGSEVPALDLAVLGSDATVSLSSFVDDRPVALIFGSYT